MDTTLFEQFVDALNGELAAIGSTHRISRSPPTTRGTMMLEDGVGEALGLVPDHVDAPTILAIEIILSAASRPGQPA